MYSIQIMSENTLTNTSLRRTARLKRTSRVHLPFFIPISLLSITRTSLSQKEVTVHVPYMVLYFKGKGLLGRIFNFGLLQSDPQYWKIVFSCLMERPSQFYQSWLNLTIVGNQTWNFSRQYVTRHQLVRELKGIQSFRTRTVVDIR